MKCRHCGSELVRSAKDATGVVCPNPNCASNRPLRAPKSSGSDGADDVVKRRQKLYD